MSILEHLWEEIQHVLGIATAIAPVVAAVDPNAAGAVAAVAKAEAAVAAVVPVVASVQAAASGQLSHEQTVDAVTKAITAGANIAAASGGLSSDKNQLVQSLAPIVEAAVLASKPTGTPAAQ